MSAKYVRGILIALKEQVASFTAVLRSSNINHARHEIDRTIINSSLIKPISDLYKDFGAMMFRRTANEIKRSAKISVVKERKAGFGINEEQILEIITFLRERLLINSIIPITETLRKSILAELIIGQESGLGVDEIARKLESPEFLLWRARMIVRTESLIAMEYGRKAATRQSKFETESEWIAANDHRTRHAHRDVDGVKVDEGKRFKVPKYKKNIIVGYDLMTGPGDPTASAGNVINCRCTMATTAKRDAGGRLITKKIGNSRISVILPGQQRSRLPIITI
jgi:hypothetical protein